MMNKLPDTARIFLALWPTVSERRALAGWQAKLKDLGRVMRPETLHATLVFIGEVEVARLEALQLAALDVSSERFDLCFDEALYWGHNHILYAAPSLVPPQLVKLVSELERHLIRHRFRFNQHEYKPHVTLLRNVSFRDDPLPAMQSICWQIKEFVLVQSASRNGEANYRVLAKFPLL